MTSGNNGVLCAPFEPIFVNETRKCLSLFYLDQEFSMPLVLLLCNETLAILSIPCPVFLSVLGIASAAVLHYFFFSSLSVLVFPDDTCEKKERL